jgi:hypothetical protein
MAVIEVPTRGRATNVRTLQIPMPFEYWYEPRWQAGDRAVTVLAGAGGDADVLLVPLRSDAQPIHVSASDTQAIWGQVLSPDGRFVAYPKDIIGSSAVWRWDLPPTR